MLNESEMERIERLSKQDQSSISRARSSISEKYYSEFQYKPEINEVSKKIARSKTVDELSKNERSKKMKQLAAARAEEKLRQECTFQPNLNESRASKEARESLASSRFRIDVSKPEKIMGRIDEYRRSRNAKLRQTRQGMEYENMKNCTFAPTTSRMPVKQQGPVVVRGLGRYLELRDLAKKLDEEKQRRTEDAFKVKGPKRSKHVKFTVPEPFKLTSQQKQKSRRAKAEEKIKADMWRGECTFEPQTTEARNRELIEQLLAEDDDIFED